MTRRLPVCIFARPPVPGRAKTRLAPEVGPEGAARLARAFLEDTWALAGSLPWARRILATTSGAGLDPPPGAEVWLQGGGDLGARIARILRRALRDAPRAFALGADSPGMPASLLAEARRRLADHDAVLGPCADGGFYVLGLTRCPPGLLGGLTWSAADTFSRARDRLRSRGFSTAVLPEWFDVDGPRELRRLARLLARGRLRAPRTARALAGLGLLPRRR
jgi:rSAM/selenodomain-associated transferase 1